MELVNLIKKYDDVRISEVIDHDRFNLITIDHHSTRIEGSTPTEDETQVLINEGERPMGNR